MHQDLDLVLLVGAVAAVQAGGGGQAERRLALIARDYKLAPHASGAPWNENLHSPQRRLIELRIEHADLDNLIDRGAESTRRSTTCCCAG